MATNPNDVELTVGANNTTTTAISPLNDPSLTNVEREELRAKQAFEPKPHPCCTSECCGKEMWKFYCCSGIGSCCDADHLTMHLFFLAFIGSFPLLAVDINYVSSGDSTAQIPTATYFAGIGFCVAVIIWSFWQINRILSGRMQAAYLMDINIAFRKKSEEFGDRIKATRDVKGRLEETHAKTVETTSLLKSKFLELKVFTDQSKIITDQNSKVAILFADKIYKLERDIEAELIASEKGVIEALYDSMHLKDKEKGLTKEEFKTFLARLPNKYKERFKFDLGFNFDQEAGSDGVLDRKELDRFMEQTIREIALEDEARNVPIAKQINNNVEDDVERVNIPLTGENNGEGAAETNE